MGADNPRGVPQMAGRESRERPPFGAARDDRLKRFELKPENRSRNNGSGQRFMALRVASEAVGCLDGNTKRGETRLRFPLQGVVHLKLPTFHSTIALQLLQIVMVTKRLLRPMSVLLSYWVLPFIVQFCGF